MEPTRCGRNNADEGSTAQAVDLEERSWLPRYCRGESAAFEALLGAFQDRVYGYLVRCGVHGAHREDLLQEVFFKIHAAAASYRPHLSLAPWVFTIVANIVRNHFRDETVRTRHLRERTEPHGAVDAAQPGIDQILEVHQLLDWLEEQIPRLPIEQREVLVLSTIDGLKLVDVATALDVPLNTVKTRLRRARITLAKRLAHLSSIRPTSRSDS